MLRRPPRSPRTDTLFPCTPRCLSRGAFFHVALIGGNDVRFPIAQSLSGGTQRLSLFGIARPGQKRGGATRALAHVGKQHFGCLSQVIHERTSSISPRTTKASPAAPAPAAFKIGRASRRERKCTAR